MEQLVRRMVRVMKQGFICLVIVASICSLAYVSPVSGYSLNTDLAYFQPHLQNDTVFGNYTFSNTWTDDTVGTPDVRIDVTDPDGIDSVWLTYRRENETSILNKSMHTSFIGNWNSYTGWFRVNVSQTETWFIVQFHANDTLGHQASSIEYRLAVYYSRPDLPSNEDYSFQFIIGLSIVLVCAGGLFYCWRKGLGREDQ